MGKDFKATEPFCDNKEYNNFIYPISLINVDNVNKKKIFLTLLPIDELANKLHIKPNTVLNTINKMLNKQLVLRDLFDYEYIPTGMEYKHGILVVKNGVYTYKYNSVKYGYDKKLYDVYLVRHKCLSLSFNIIYRKLLAEMFPHLFIKNEDNGVLFKEDFKYSLEQRNCLKNLTKELSVSNIPYELTNLPIKDIARCLNNKKRINDIIYKTRISCFFESDCIYIYLFDVNINGYSYKRSLYMPLEALFTKDYDLIANKFVSSQAILNENGKREFINGSQKDMPYFNNERTQKILTYILK